MSKTPKPTQTKSRPKLTADVTAKKQNTSTVKTATSSIPKASTKPKSTSATNKDGIEKTKTRAAGPTALPAKPRTQNSIDKTQKALPARSTSTTKGPASTPTGKNNAPQKRTPQNVTARTVERSQPLRAKYSPAIVEAVKKNTSSVTKNNAPAKPNAVLDSYHSVTVSSPPERRKDLQSKAENKDDVSGKRVRTRSRTLDPEEVIVLRRESAKKRIEEQIQTEDEVAQKLPIRESVAFEVNFEEKAKARERSKSRGRNETTPDTDPDNYSDDFESYESDFEAGSSTPNSSLTDSEESSGDSEDISEGVSDESTADSGEEREYSANAMDDAEVESEDESELTQYPITVIQRDKEHERKLDSGNYEINSRKQPRISEISMQSSQLQFDSLDTFSATNSEQLDSGISSYGNGKQAASDDPHTAVIYGGYTHFNTRPILSKRGVELMTKIQFDTLTFTLFELKPISYDIYMQTYGKLNSTQTATQTLDNRMSTDCQTNDCDMRSMWTQHPPQYDLQTVQKLGSNGSAVQNCCGEMASDELNVLSQPADEFEASLHDLMAFRQNGSSRCVNQQLKRLRKPIDFERLNAFLLNSSLLMSKVLNSAQHSNKHQRSHRLETNRLLTVSEGFFKLGTQFLNALRVVRIFANSRYNIVITVHESMPDADVYRSDFSNLLMVWSTSESDKPIRLLSTWSEVCRAEICNDSSDIVVCGLRDGSIAMWDLRETYSFCSKLDGHLTHFAATQSIVPTWGVGDAAKKLVDLGAVVDVKSFRSSANAMGLSGSTKGYKSIQLSSLNDTGILTVWTLVENTALQYNDAVTTHQKTRYTPNQSSRFEYSSPWARVKLIQSGICDLREYVDNGISKVQSQFDKTKSLFQKNIYNDEVLRELNETQSDLRQGQGLHGLRFTSIDTGCERIYVCTNRNFILGCSKSLKTERFRKIAINDSRFLFPTALCVLTNEDFLAVGLSNGSVMILNCNQHKLLLTPEAETSSLATNDDTNKPNDTPDIDLETGKSCAIQNIILNERRSLDVASSYEQDYDLRPTTAACIAMITNQKKPFELRVYDQQLLLSGSVLRKHLVQSLELSSDGWRLFALSNGEMRTYDFYLDRELENPSAPRISDSQRILDIAVARTSHNEQNLLLLTANDDVEVHLLKQ